MKKLILAGAAVLLASASASGSAIAADLPVYKAPAAPVVVPVYDWNGFYIGGFIGGAWSSGDVTATDVNGYNGVGNTWSYNLTGSLIGGGTIGFNWQAPGSAFVAGLEAELGYLHLTGSATDPASPALDTSSDAKIGDWYAVIAGRLGYAWDRLLVYAKGGFAFANLDAAVVDTCTTGACGGGTVTATGSTTATGWALGGGLEYGWTNNWSIKAEYLYLGLNKTVRACGPGGGTAAGATWCWDHDFKGAHTIKAGLNYRFNWTPIAAAKY